ncbi:EFR1 family ferrodoxin [Citroniella saccharovorans]|uniref:EFR1 family ferrodoxin n=1 Tax=Citroniella saccharovorans TaxID=2053367 RepID=A0AAW9MZL1_9FIRM|nr:EFR1 family ferrodoxin [Citroniella saccharovorans]MEB3429982.1 EFR1 family ferrodoxin [Citroniella saccharovorans]
MILYFSGTGNSEFLAEELGKILEDSILNLFDFIKENRITDFYSDKPFILIAPTYSWRLPRFISNYLGKCKFSGSSDIYVILNFGDSFGNAEIYLKKDIEKLGLNFRGLYGIKMPENYLMLFDLDNDEKNREIVLKSKDKLNKISEYIKNNEDFPKNNSGFIGKFESGLINPLFFKFIVKDKKFYYSKKCIKCGLCEKVCVLNNISYENGYPKWNGNCTHCAACICKCPASAIEYGNKTLGKKRYLLKNLFNK